MNIEKWFLCTEHSNKEFESSMKSLLNAPTWGFPRDTETFVLCSKASISANGAVSTKSEGRQPKFFLYAGKILQRNY